jgi:PEP-CTERM motif
VLVKYTYYGDTNLDGVVEGTDYSLIDNTFNQQTASLAYTASQIATATAEIASPGGSGAAVPEPASIELIGIGAIGLMARRRRRA